jgi:RNA ligase (TIGR02306 family)
MENNNSVCFVGKVTDIKLIDGADNIELVVVNGWNCISKKGEHRVDELTIIATTDAVIPQALSDEMGVTNYLRKGGRVRTIKLRGVYSECLIISFIYAEELTHPKARWSEGTDMMDLLKITKYEPPVRQVQLASGRKVKYKDNPNFHVYYKFPNFKNVPNMFTEDDVVEITRKIHGTNARYGIIKKTKLSLWDRFKKLIRVADKWIDYEFIYGSHNVEKGSDTQGFYDTDVWRTIADQYDIKNKLWNHVKSEYTPKNLGTGFIIYGEIYGKGIQKNYEYGLDTIKFAGFDVEENGVYLSTFESWRVIKNKLDLDYVPILSIGDWSQKIQDIYTFNQFIDNTKVPHEGIVIKHVSGDRKKVAKVINPDYLIYAEKKDVGDSH